MEARSAVDVNEVEERTSTRWHVWGRVEDRREARHLMYVMKMCVKHPDHDSKESFWRKSERRDDVV